jgi:ketosteroid isomerase-like protein
MSEHDNVATVRAAYAAWRRGDIPAVLDALTEDVEWEMPGPPEIVPYAGLWRGQAAMTRYFAVLSETVEFEEYELESIVAQGDQVVVVGRSRVLAKQTGRAFDDHFAHWFEFRGGKAARMRYYTDTAAAVAALSGAGQPAQAR